LPPPTVTDLPIRDDFDAITVADRSVLNRSGWKDETGSAYDAFEYMTRHRSVPKETRARSNSEMTFQKPHVGRRPSGLKPPTLERGPDAGRKRSGTTPKLVQMELVEERILEDGPKRTISVWREQVATDTAKERVPQIHLPGPTNGKRHRRTQSDAGDGQTAGIPVSARLTDGREIINRARNMSSVRGGLPLAFMRDLTLVQPVPSSPLKKSFNAQSNASLLGPTPQQSPRKASQTLPGGSSRANSPILSRKQGRMQAAGGGSLSGTSSGASTLELLLGSCQPSLLHLTESLQDLGIQREEHLRALAKMHEETRDREVKEEALKRGVTVVEWAIFLDKLKALYSYDDMYVG
jgi:hypothetical protein